VAPTEVLVSKAFASGNFTGTLDTYGPLRLDAKYTGDYGLLLSGNFDSLTATVYVYGLINPHTGAELQNYAHFSPSGIQRAGMSFAYPGMYFLGDKIGNYLEAFAFYMDSSIGATDIDWTLFLKARP
jgi:hypothetical protein